ncbi:NUDIX hydrolase [Sulfurimonas sp. MAG313]|nr:NUDIX hydrolase [Sulfurimonas sp. MAG313]MDF1882242.1 NUDIX hydrolase [Sulfurimonas sp. MAG313]
MIKDIHFTACENSSFVTTKRMHYKQKDIDKIWDMVEVHDSVAVLIYHKEKNAFILVKQLRPPVYLKNKDGFTYELCAGIVDKDCSLTQIVKEEIDEECGFNVPAEKIEKITSFYTAVGFAGSKQSLYYCEVDETMHDHEGGGIHVEDIEVIYLDVNEIESFIFDESKAKTPGVMYAMMWWKQKYETSL